MEQKRKTVIHRANMTGSSYDENSRNTKTITN